MIKNLLIRLIQWKIIKYQNLFWISNYAIQKDAIKIPRIIMLISFILFATKISSILSGSLNIIIILIGCSLVISAILTFIAGFLTIYYDGKIVGCIELFELMLKAKVKTNNNDD